MRHLTNGLVGAVGLALLGFLLLVSLPELLGGGSDGGAPRRGSPGAGGVPVAADGPGATDPAPAGSSDAAASVREPRCPPCGMSMPADTEFVEIAGRRWALCSERCAEAVAADPEAFAADAVAPR